MENSILKFFGSGPWILESPLTSILKEIYQKLVWLQTLQPHGEVAYSQSCHTWYTHPHAGIGSIGLFCQILFLQLWLPHWKKEGINDHCLCKRGDTYMIYVGSGPAFQEHTKVMFLHQRRYHHILRSTDGLTVLAWIEIVAILVHYQPSCNT